MAKKFSDSDLQNLPDCAVEFVRLVIRKMGYRKKVRADVQTELAAHFEDELRDCKTDTEKEKRAQRLIDEFGDVKLLAVLLRRAIKRCRPLWRTVVARSFQTVGILILCLIVYCIYISLGQPTIGINYVEKLMLMTRPVADESQNAAPLYQKAIDAFKEPPLVEDEIGTEKSLLVAIRDKDWIDDLDDNELSALKQWISDNSEAINLFEQASHRSYCWWNRRAEDNIVLDVLLPELNEMRSFARLLCWRAKLRAFDGDAGGAFDDLLTCYRAGRHYKGPRFLIEQLVGITVQAMSAGTAMTILNNQQVESNLLKSFQAELEKLMAEDTFIMDLNAEKFLALDFIQRCYTNNGSGSGHMIPSSVGAFPYFEFGGFENSVLNYSQFLAVALVSADRGNMSREFEKIYDTAQEWTYKTPWQLREENVDLEMGMDKWSRLKQIQYWPVMVLLPAFVRASEIGHRSKIGFEALLTIVALLRYHQDNGQYPQNLAELIAGDYLKQLPMDSYSAQTLIYKRTDGDFIIYSVGPNFTDDGGTVAEDGGILQKWGTKEQGDIVFWPEPKSLVKQQQ